MLETNKLRYCAACCGAEFVGEEGIWNSGTSEGRLPRASKIARPLRDHHIVVEVLRHLHVYRNRGRPITIPDGELMRRLPAAAACLFVFPSRVLAGALFISLMAPFEQFQAEALPAGTLHAPICESEDTIVFHSNVLSNGDMSCPTLPRPSIELTEARAYLVDTAIPGYTMTRQGPELAIRRLNPEFAIRLAGALRDARESGLPSAGIFSAYRPPAFGVGGFSDKFNSLHAYGLAVDLLGIGGPGSLNAQRWHEIAAKHGVICPYGPGNRAEWNHCQPTSLKAVMANSPLREVITAEGPVSLESMFEAGNMVIQSSANIEDTVGKDVPVHARARPLGAKSRSRTARGIATVRGGA